MALTQTKKGARLDHPFSDFIDDAVKPAPAEAAPAVEPVSARESSEVTAPETVPTEVVADKKPKVKGKGSVKPPEIQGFDLEDNDLDAALSALRSNRGAQRSIYIEADIHQFITDKCEKTGAKYSNVVNLLLRKAISGK